MVALNRQVTFVVPVKVRGEILERNLLLSPCLRVPRHHQIIIQEGFPSAATAYNNAIEKSVNDLIVFCHEDVYLPENWDSQLACAIDYLQLHDPNWGVLGCAGITRNKRLCGHVYSTGLGVLGEPSDRPQPVQTLDELVLILRKSSGLRFSESLPHFHLYGTDICMRAAKSNMNSYAISAFCIHNTREIVSMPREFYECYKQIKRMWKEYLPIQTTCIRITKWNISAYATRLRERHAKYRRGGEFGMSRSENVCQILEAQNTSNVIDDSQKLLTKKLNVPTLKKNEGTVGGTVEY
jgi:hypothetical protein